MAAVAATVAGCELLRRPARSDSAMFGGAKPNILVLICDQLRAPQWFPDDLDDLLPGIARLRRASVSFESHFSASNMCTPARGVMTTGLYSHQTGCLYTSGGSSPSAIGGNPTAESVLSPKFPTWGSMLRDHGYRTWWWGKWHLGPEGDNTAPDGLEPYGFSGGTFPSPNGGNGQGLRSDPGIVDQFAAWFDAEAGNGPWCTTVSLVNPHDIVYWPRWQEPADVPIRFTSAAPNFETPAQLRSRRKPGLQLSLQSFMEPLIHGEMASSGPEAQRQWARQLDVYLWLQQQVDIQVARVLDILTAHPDIDRNTVVVFTADHGEYGGSHGLSGKGGAAYEEAIKVPLYIRDPHGTLTPKSGDTRAQLTSSVDLAPLLLTIGTGGNTWRDEERYAHLVHRADIATIAQNHSTPGRSWVAHVTDDVFVEEAGAAIHTTAPEHLIAVRTTKGKLGVYSHWLSGDTDIDPSAPQERELYDYSTNGGRSEVDNSSSQGNPLETELQDLWQHEVLPEIHASLPPVLNTARDEGMSNMRDMMRSRNIGIGNLSKPPGR
ncbi:sulfatase family protein [Mycobacteroides abscessus subsp. massiliense]|nr:sulfatase family protein [Mycobacteroides abscessus subsp. massiliense]